MFLTSNKKQQAESSWDDNCAHFNDRPPCLASGQTSLNPESVDVFYRTQEYQQHNGPRKLSYLCSSAAKMNTNSIQQKDIFQLKTQ